MAEEAKCSKVTIINIRRNLRQFGSVHAPLNSHRSETNRKTANDRRALRPSVGKIAPLVKCCLDRNLKCILHMIRESSLKSVEVKLDSKITVLQRFE
jgi:hypothetical protein